MTVGTNALLEQRGRADGAVATRGFADLLEIARQNRPQPLPPVRAHADAAGRPGGADRGRASGSGPRGWSSRSTTAELDRIAAEAAELGVESVAICLLFSYLDPGHERAIAERLRERLDGVHVSASSEVLPQFREYERCSTTVIDAYLSPLLDRYLGRLGEAAAERGLPEPAVMMSSGGVAPAAEAARAGAWSVLSGPAGGAVGAGLLARLSGDGNALGFDMGGTSCDVCVVEDGRVRQDRLARARRAGDPAADGRRAHGRRRRRLDRLARLRRRAAGRPALGGRRAGARLLRARRHGADGHRRQPRCSATSGPPPSSPAGSSSTAAPPRRAIERLARRARARAARGRRGDRADREHRDGPGAAGGHGRARASTRGGSR